MENQEVVGLYLALYWMEYKLQWAPLNGITDNRINQIMGSIYAVLSSPISKTCSHALE
jgi:hypothetical protein